MNKLVLSLFPGIGLLDMAFEQCGFCVVRGPDKLWGGDIKNFHPPEGHIWGIIGGPPCQEFSGLRRLPPTGYGIEMLIQFARCVTEAKPEWWLLENVARVPNLAELGHTVTEQLSHNYTIQRLDINQGWYCDVTRLRHIQFGSRTGKMLDIPRRSITDKSKQGAALANDDRSFEQICQLQGLPEGYDLPGFLAREKKRAVGNGVPLVMGKVLAQAVKEAYSQNKSAYCDRTGHSKDHKRCKCGCGRRVTGKALYSDYACRKRAQRQRERDAAGTNKKRDSVTWPI